MARFTIANAREMAARAREARQRNEQARLNAPPPAPLQPVEPADEYLAERIASARAEIRRLTDLSRKERDALNCERLARAVGQWSEIERILSGRALPGSKRPAEERPAVPGDVLPVS